MKNTGLIRSITLLSFIFVCIFSGCVNDAAEKTTTETVSDSVVTEKNSVPPGNDTDSAISKDPEQNSESINPETQTNDISEGQSTKDFAEDTTEDETRAGSYEQCTEHNFDIGTKILKATCEKPGKIKKTCTICGYSETSETPPTEHITVTDPYKAPTCTDTGLTEGKHCIVCEKIIEEQKIIPKTGHQYTDGICQNCRHHRESTGLIYQISESGDFYTVTGRGSCSDNYIVIPEKYNNLPVRKISDSAFTGDTDIYRITLPDTVEYIGDRAFAGCVHLAEIFNFSSLGVTIQSAANGCIGLYAYAVHTSEDDDSVIFTDENGYRFARVGDVATYLGKSADTNEIMLPDKLTVGNTEISSYNIDKYAFHDGNDIKRVSIPESVKILPKNLLTNCTSIEYLSLPFMGQSVSDTDHAFLGYLFGADTYEYNSSYVPYSLKEVTVLSQNIYDYAFYGCNVSCVRLKGGTKTIGRKAFYGCGKLEYIFLPDTIDFIDNYAFYGCPLKTLYYGGDESSWNRVNISAEGNSAIISAEKEFENGTPVFFRK